MGNPQLRTQNSECRIKTSPMFVCGCGRWMHTEGIDEQVAADGSALWFVRSECRGCGLHIGTEMPAGQTEGLVDRVLWTDDARHRIERLPPYIRPLLKEHIESYASTHNQRVITYDLVDQARTGEVVGWEPEAERRLEKVPAPVRAMAKIELERTAAERGEPLVTVALMEEVKAQYFGMRNKREP